MAETLEQAVAAGQRALANDIEREARIANAEMEFSDGFLSSWAAGLTIRKGERAKALLADGGEAWFYRLELADAQTGETVAAKLIDGTYGECWALCDGAEQFTGEFVSASPKRAATMERKGYAEKITVFRAAALVDIKGSGTGLAGATSCYVATIAADRELKYTGCLGTWEDLEAWLWERTLKGAYLGWQKIAVEL